MTLYFMRHGETDYNRSHRLQGRLNKELNDNGIAQAEIAYKDFKDQGIIFDHVISSPLIRAYKTASLVSGKDLSEIEKEDRIIEISFGDMEGKTVEELDDNMRNFFVDPVNYKAPLNGEGYEDLLERIKDFLDEIIESDLKGNILVLSHGAALHAMYMLITGDTLDNFWNATVGNCGYFMAEPENGKFKVTGLNFREENKTIPKSTFLENS